MSKRFGKYRVLTPEFCIGEAIGRLSNIGAWLDGQNEENDLIAILTRVPMENMPTYELWLNEQSAGNGRVIFEGECEDP